MEWINIKDELPDHGNDVLVKLKDGTKLMGRFNKSVGTFWKLYFSDTGLQFDKYRSDSVVFWMELPL